MTPTEAEGSRILAESDAIISLQDVNKRDLSYDLCLASWAYWIVDTHATDEDNDDDGFRREDIIVSLISGLGPNRREDVRPENDKVYVLF